MMNEGIIILGVLIIGILIGIAISEKAESFSIEVTPNNLLRATVGFN